MQRTENVTFTVLNRLVRHAAWVLIASMFLIACGSGSEGTGDNAPATTPQGTVVRNSPAIDTPTPPVSPSAVETRAEHERMTASPTTATSTSTATPSPTEASAPSAYATPAGSATTEPESAGVAEVEILDFAFDPPLLEITAGTTVTFINRGVDHTATARDDPAIFDTGILHTGESFSVTFATAGMFDYWCLLHPDMVGAIVVQ